MRVQGAMQGHRGPRGWHSGACEAPGGATRLQEEARGGPGCHEGSGTGNTQPPRQYTGPRVPQHPAFQDIIAPFPGPTTCPGSPARPRMASTFLAGRYGQNLGVKMEKILIRFAGEKVDAILAAARACTPRRPARRRPPPARPPAPCPPSRTWLARLRVILSAFPISHGPANTRPPETHHPNLNYVFLRRRPHNKSSRQYHASKKLVPLFSSAFFRPTQDISWGERPRYEYLVYIHFAWCGCDTTSRLGEIFHLRNL